VNKNGYFNETRRIRDGNPYPVTGILTWESKLLNSPQ
jgi:hypothetical protein